MTDFLLCNTKHDFLKKCNYYSQGLKILGFKKTQSAIKHYNRKLYTKMYFTSLVNWQLCGLNGTVQHLNYSMSRSLTRHQGISDEHDRYRVWVTIWAIGLVARGAMSWRGSSAGTCTYLQWIDKKKLQFRWIGFAHSLHLKVKKLWAILAQEVWTDTYGPSKCPHLRIFVSDHLSTYSPFPVFGPGMNITSVCRTAD